jgi:hypothetical protein
VPETAGIASSPPDAALIRLTREGAGISVAHAAKTAGISKARWVQVENGREARRGEVRPARAKPITIAHMARAVGLSPGRLESEGRNPEAAAILREIIRQQEAARLPRTTSGTPSYSLAKARIREKVDDLLFTFAEEYGLTDVEIADVLADILHGYLRGAVSDEQEQNEAREGAIGTPHC